MLKYVPYIEWLQWPAILKGENQEAEMNDSGKP